MRGEFEWISHLAGILADAGQGIGDDAAVLPGEEGLVWTIDTLVEGVHFRFDWQDAPSVGRRALAASLSDLAAMGAEPRGALVAVAGGRDALGARLEGTYEGIAELAEGAGCPIMGGDLACAQAPLTLTVTALGSLAGRPPLLRSGAQAGDALWVTGTLGGPAAALALLDSSGATAEVRAHPAYYRLVHPQPRNRELRWLRERVELSAAIDVSDGLSGDAGHVAERSGVRIAIEAGRLPVDPGAALAARRLARDPLDWALHGGDELELLLSAAEGAVEQHALEFGEAFGIRLTRIGSVEKGEGVALIRNGKAEPLTSRSWDHFRLR